MRYVSSSLAHTNANLAYNVIYSVCTDEEMTPGTKSFLRYEVPPTSSEGG